MLMKAEVGPGNTEDSFPAVVLQFIRWRYQMFFIQPHSLYDLCEANLYLIYGYLAYSN